MAFLADTNWIMSVAFAPRDGLLASASFNDVQLWDTRTRGELRRLTNAAAPTVFSPDGRFLLTSHGPLGRDKSLWREPQTALVWDTVTWEVVQRASFASSGISSSSRDLYLQLAFGSGSDRVAVLTGNTVRLVTCPGLEEALVLGHELPESVSARPFLALSPDNRILAIPSPKGYGVQLWDVVEDRELRVLPGHADHIFSARFSPDGTQLATASPDQTVKLWDVATGALLHTFLGQADEVVDLAFSPDGTRLVSLGITDSVVKVWDAGLRAREEWLVRPQGFDPGGNLVAMGSEAALVNPADWTSMPFPSPRHPGVSLANKLNSLSADGRYHALWRYDERSLEVWDRRLGEVMCAIPNQCLNVSFDTRRQWVFTGVTNTVGEVELAAWQLPAGTLKWRQPGMDLFNRAITATTAGDYAVTMAGTNCLVSRLEGDELKPVLTLPVTASATISPDGHLLATALGDITLRTLPEGKVVGVLKGHTRKTVRLAFSPDSRTLASIADDHTARLWHLATQRELLRFPAPCEDHDHFQLEFSPDGRALACYRHDGDHPVTSLYFAPSFAEIAATEGGDYAALAGEDAPTWLAVSQELLRGGKLEVAWVACVRAGELSAGHDAVDWWLGPQIQRHRIDLLRRRGCWEEAARENCALLKIPARDPMSPAGAIDLSAFYNNPFAYDGPEAMNANDLRELPQGTQELDGTVFDLRGVIVARRPWLRQNVQAEPTRVDGIRIGRKLIRLHLLQMASGDSTTTKTGDLIGHYIIHFSDGRSAEIPLRYNADFSDYWELDHLPKELPGATLAWRGQNPQSRSEGHFIRLFKRTWQNPFPEVEVTHLDLVADLAQTQPWLIALTAE